MNYNLVEREVITLGEDLTELGETIIVEPKEPSSRVPHAVVVKPVPDVLAELTRIQQRLSALVNYIQGDIVWGEGGEMDKKIEMDRLCQCCSCEQIFQEAELVDGSCPNCGSGNWVFDYIDNPEPKGG